MRLDQSVPHLVNDAYLIHHKSQGKDYALEQQKRSNRLEFGRVGDATHAHIKVRNEWAIVDTVEVGIVLDIVAKLTPVQRAWAEWAYIDEHAGFGGDTINSLYQDYVVKALNHWGEGKKARDSQSVLRVVTTALKSYRFSIFSGQRWSARDIASKAQVNIKNAARDWDHWIEWGYSYADQLDRDTRVGFRNRFNAIYVTEAA